MKKIYRFFHEYGADIVIVLVVGILFMLFELIRRNSVIFENMQSARYTVDVISKVFTMILGTITAIATYRRFFKGRTFSEKATVKMVSNPIRWLTKDNKYLLLHTVEVEVLNIGAKTIWEPQLHIKILDYFSNEKICEVAKEGIQKFEQTKGGISGIEPGETIVFFQHFSIPKETKVFKAITILNTNSGNQWHRALLLANTFNAKDETPWKERKQSNSSSSA